MFYKLLIVFYIWYVFTCWKSLFNREKLTETIERHIEKDGENKTENILIITAIVLSITMITFYIKSYNLSELIGWLSVIQVIGAVRSWSKVTTTVHRYKKGELKNPKWIIKLVFTLLNTWYIWLVVTKVVEIGG